jgi:TatD DNase family protein
MRLFDTHTHIQGSEYDADRSSVIERARGTGVSGMLVLGTDVASSKAAIDLAARHPDVLAAAGCHPHDAGDMNAEALASLADMAGDKSVVAVGEIGIDFFRNLSPPARQIEVFQCQLRVAAEVSKPVAVHAREAHDTMLPLLTSWSRSVGGKLTDGRPLGVMHYFSGEAELALGYVELGLLISVHTSVTHPRATVLQDVARSVPLSKLVVETDSPYGAPQSHRGRRNEPAFVVESVSMIARLRGESVDAVARATTDNACSLFNISTSARQAIPAQLRGAL